jgi:hypothetical protein
MPTPRKDRNKCLNCDNLPERANYKYCSNSCQLEYQHADYIRRWLLGEISGLQSIGVVSVHIKRYLREKYGDKCVQCGWSEINELTGRTPLVADHVDGNWRNNVESNLRLLCPNCDALTPTYAGLNRGNGRQHRVVSKRVAEAREFNKSHLSSVGRAPLS